MSLKGSLFAYFKKIWNWLKLKYSDTPSEYIIKHPKGMRYKEWLKFVDRTAKERMKELESENLKLKAELQARKEEEKKKDKIKETRDRAIKAAEGKKKGPEDYTLAARFYVYDGDKTKKMDPLPNFFFSSGRGYKKLKGFFIEEDGDGGLRFHPWLTGSKETKFKAAAPTFEDFFKSKIYIPSQLLGGKADTNFDLDSAENPIFKGSPPSENKDQQIKKLKDQVGQLQSALSKYDEQLKKLRKRNARLRSRLNDVDAAREAAEGANAVAQSKLRQTASSVSGLARDAASAYAGKSQSAMRAAISEQDLAALMESLEEKRKKLAEAKSKTSDERAKERIKQHHDDVIDMQNKLKAALTVQKPKPPSPARPRGTKEGEEGG